MLLGDLLYTRLIIVWSINILSYAVNAISVHMQVWSSNLRFAFYWLVPFYEDGLLISF
jgi:hypothetical protein